MRLLIIGTLDGQIGAASQIAIQRGSTVQQADTIDQALQSLRSGEGADLIMIDVGQDVVNLIQSLEAERFSVPVIACGVGNDTQAAVRAIRAGAKEYIPLPPDTDLIAAVLEAVSQDTHAIIHKDQSMIKLLQTAEQIAASDAGIMISGASGTGKELLAQFIHRKSRRTGGRFVAVNCAAIPENLLESELFGHEKGAFTGAVARRLGKFEEANNGTLLLDEISEMDIRLQAKLLRAIQEQEIDRLGGSKPVKVNVRILATTNRDMDHEIKAGNFREDLYFRLNVVSLVIPPLAERKDDLEALCAHFLEKFSDANSIPFRPLSPEAKVLLEGHSWPGNVRELENTMHRAVLLANGPVIGPDAIMLGSSGSTEPAAAATLHADGQSGLVGRTVSDVERELIIDTLQHCFGNRTHAANILGISIRTLRNKLKQYNEQGISVPAPGDGERVPL